MSASAPTPTPSSTLTTTRTTPVILGSSSKWRAGIIREMGVNVVRQLNPDIDEYAIKVPGYDSRLHTPPEQLCLAVARAKSIELIKQLESTNTVPTEPTILITCDQVAYFNGEIREKPKNIEQCRQWFSQYSQQPIQVVSGVVMVNTHTKKSYEGVAPASQLFSPNIPSSIIDGVIATGDILQCCGGFLVDDQRLLPYLSTRVGTEDELIGMPKKLIRELLAQAEADIHDHPAGVRSVVVFSENGQDAQSGRHVSEKSQETATAGERLRQIIDR